MERIASPQALPRSVPPSAPEPVPRKAPSATHWRTVHIPRERLQALLDSGLRQSEIAAVLGTTLRTIENRVRQWGLQTYRTGPRLSTGHAHSWGDGRSLAKFGYIDVYVPKHPNAHTHTGKHPEHRLLLEILLGRYLTPIEVVHHKNNCPYDNFPENLGLHACNADHLREELTGREKSTPRKSIPGAYGCSQTIGRCPSADETLVRTPLDVRLRLERYIDAHRPTFAQQRLRFREILRSGADLDPFRFESTD